MPRISPDITAEYHGETFKGAARVNQKYYDLVEQAVESKRAEYNDQMAELMEKPHEALVADFVYLYGVYDDRHVDVPHDDGTRETQFATRRYNDETGKYELDDRYKVIETPDGHIVYSIQARLVDDMGYDIIFDADGVMSVRTIVTGYQVPMQPDRYPWACKHMLERTIATARIVNDRQQKYPQTAQYAHQNAKELLEDELGL